ncbi:MAG: hypothetical protein EPN43_11315 [Jatrophihabitans sp.]|nr:MAG: hypothetical protein EPN43_11315 [Jatrophihabitans sp.]
MPPNVPKTARTTSHVGDLWGLPSRGSSAAMNSASPPASTAAAVHSRGATRCASSIPPKISVSGNSIARTGSTEDSVPVASAAACSRNDAVIATSATSHSGRCRISPSSRSPNSCSSASRFTLRCSTLDSALQPAATAARKRLKGTIPLIVPWQGIGVGEDRGYTTPEPVGRVLIVTAAMGAGHVAVAAELARRLRDRAAEITTVDLVADVPVAGLRLRRTYRTLLSRAPWLYDGAMRFWARRPGAMERLTALGDGPFADAIAQRVAQVRPDVVVSTYNLGSQCLGRLRARGQLDVPVITIVTDPAAHPYWLGARGDRYLAFLPRTVADLRRLGVTAELVRPLLRPEFARPPQREAARAALALRGRVVLVSGGSWAAGDVLGTVGALAGDPGVTAVVLCGRDQALRRALTGRPGVVPLGWTEDVAGVLTAADVLVDNAGGLTCWEALSVGCPVVEYKPLPGHGRLNARVLAQVGLATPAADPRTLRAAVRRARPAAFAPSGADAADVVLARTGSRA